jgi:hypothetical protein
MRGVLSSGRRIGVVNSPDFDCDFHLFHSDLVHGPVFSPRQLETYAGYVAIDLTKRHLPQLLLGRMWRWLSGHGFKVASNGAEVALQADWRPESVAALGRPSDSDTDRAR